MQRAEQNATELAKWLKTRDCVKKVIYPGLSEHPGHEIQKKQARGFGAMLASELESKEYALAVLEKLRMIKYAESLGGVETLITYPTTQTHADVPEEIRLKNGITDSVLRISVGIEDAEDIIGELSRVFDEIDGK
jgi:cystathionine gamma-synthase